MPGFLQDAACSKRAAAFVAGVLMLAVSTSVLFQLRAGLSTLFSLTESDDTIFLPSIGASSSQQSTPTVEGGREDTCSTTQGHLPGLSKTLVVVERDSYARMDRHVVATEIEAIEETWGSWMPHMVYVLRNDSMPSGSLSRTSGEEYLTIAVGEGKKAGLSNRAIVTYGTDGLEYWDKEALQWKFFFNETRNHSDIDWVLIVNLETYIVAPNLCSLIQRLQVQVGDPVLIGRPMLGDGWKYPGASTSAGILLSRRGFDAFAESSSNFDALKQGGEPSKHMARAGLFVRDSRDEHGRERFQLFSPLGETYEQPEPFAQAHCCWFVDQSFYGFHTGLECCAATTITFHYIEPKEHRALHYVLLRVAELRRQSALHSAKAQLDLVEDVFGSSWPRQGAADEYGFEWRDPKYFVGSNERAPKGNNSLVRELLANRIVLGELGPWNVSRVLAPPAWSQGEDWLAKFRSSQPR